MVFEEVNILFILLKSQIFKIIMQSGYIIREDVHVRESRKELSHKKVNIKHFIINLEMFEIK